MNQISMSFAGIFALKVFYAQFGVHTALLLVIHDADKILHAVIMVTHTNGATPTLRTIGTIAARVHAISMVTTTCGVSLVQNGNIVAMLDLEIRKVGSAWNQFPVGCIRRSERQVTIGVT
jgi:hypothetical protein